MSTDASNVYRPTADASGHVSSPSKITPMQVTDAMVEAAEVAGDTECMRRDIPAPPREVYRIALTAALSSAPEGEPVAWDFEIGDRVEKFTGEACWNGFVVSRYLTSKGGVRYVVEVEPQGFQMIAVPGQLRAAAHPPASHDAIRREAFEEAAKMIEQGDYEVTVRNFGGMTDSELNAFEAGTDAARTGIATAIRARGE